MVQGWYERSFKEIYPGRKIPKYLLSNIRKSNFQIEISRAKKRFENSKLRNLHIRTYMKLTKMSFFQDGLVYVVSAICIALGFYFLTAERVSRKNQTVVEEKKSLRVAEPVNPNRVFTLADLKQYNGHIETKPIYVGVKGLVYDVSAAEAMYGPKGGYNSLAGRDASRALAKMELECKSSDISDLPPYEKHTLDEWNETFRSKYTVVGSIYDESEPNSGTIALPKTATNAAATPSVMSSNVSTE